MWTGRTPNLGSATSRRWMGMPFTRKPLRVLITQYLSAATARLQHVGATVMGGATFQRWMGMLFSGKPLQVLITRCFFAATARLQHVDATVRGSATSQSWMGMSFTRKGALHTVLLRSDGKAATCGCNSGGRCDIPALEGDLSTHTLREVRHAWCKRLLLKMI